MEDGRVLAEVAVAHAEEGSVAERDLEAAAAATAELVGRNKFNLCREGRFASDIKEILKILINFFGR